MIDYDFSGKCVLITGGSKGIGRALSRAFAERNATVIVNYSTDEDAAREIIDEIAGMGKSARAIRADVSKSEEVENLFGQIRKEPARLDILINNAGIIRDKLLMFMSEDDWDRVIDVNLKGVYLCSKSATRLMIGQKYGKIVNIVSPSALLGRAGQVNYASSKGGVLSFTKSLARELARFNIFVNAVSPGIVETEMTGKIAEQHRSEFLSAIPMGRFGTTQDIVGAVLFLSSEQSSYVTGQVISVDGGLT